MSDLRLRDWERQVGLGRWVDRDSLTSPNWSGADSSELVVTAQSVSKAPTDNKVVIIPRAIVRFHETVLAAGQYVYVRFFGNPEATHVAEIRYNSIFDFHKRSAPGGIQMVEVNDPDSGLVGTFHEILIDFIDSGKPVIIFPVSEAANGRVTKMTVGVANGPLKKVDGTVGGMSCVRYDGICIYEMPVEEQ
jgi:hypothetical protein